MNEKPQDFEGPTHLETPSPNASPDEQQAFWENWLQKIVLNPDLSYAQFKPQWDLLQQDLMQGVDVHVTRQVALNLARENLTRPILPAAYRRGLESGTASSIGSVDEDNLQGSEKGSLSEYEEELDEFWANWRDRQQEITGAAWKDWLTQLNGIANPGEKARRILQGPQDKEGMLAALDLRFERFQAQYYEYLRQKEKEPSSVSADMKRHTRLTYEEQALTDMFQSVGETLDQWRDKWHDQLRTRQTPEQIKRIRKYKSRNLEAEVEGMQEQLKRAVATAERLRRDMPARRAALIPRLEEWLRQAVAHRQALDADDSESPEAFDALTQLITERRALLDGLKAHANNELGADDTQARLEEEIRKGLPGDSENLASFDKLTKEVSLRVRLLDGDELHLRQLVVGSPLEAREGSISESEATLARQERSLLRDLRDRINDLRRRIEDGDMQENLPERLRRQAEKLNALYRERRERLQARREKLMAECDAFDARTEENTPQAAQNEAFQIHTSLRRNLQLISETMFEDLIWRLNQLTETAPRNGPPGEEWAPLQEELHQGLQTLSRDMTEWCDRAPETRAEFAGVPAPRQLNFLRIVNSRFRDMEAVLNDQLANQAWESMPEERALLEAALQRVQQTLLEVRQELPLLLQTRVQSMRNEFTITRAPATAGEIRRMELELRQLRADQTPEEGNSPSPAESGNEIEQSDSPDLTQWDVREELAVRRQRTREQQQKWLDLVRGNRALLQEYQRNLQNLSPEAISYESMQRESQRLEQEMREAQTALQQSQNEMRRELNDVADTLNEMIERLEEERDQLGTFQLWALYNIESSLEKLRHEGASQSVELNELVAGIIELRHLTATAQQPTPPQRQAPPTPSPEHEEQRQQERIRQVELLIAKVGEALLSTAFPERSTSRAQTPDAQASTEEPQDMSVAEDQGNVDAVTKEQDEVDVVAVRQQNELKQQHIKWTRERERLRQMAAKQALDVTESKDKGRADALADDASPSTTRRSWDDLNADVQLALHATAKTLYHNSGLPYLPPKDFTHWREGSALMSQGPFNGRVIENGQTHGLGLILLVAGRPMEEMKKGVIMETDPATLQGIPNNAKISGNIENGRVANLRDVSQTLSHDRGAGTQTDVVGGGGMRH